MTLITIFLALRYFYTVNFGIKLTIKTSLAMIAANWQFRGRRWALALGPESRTEDEGMRCVNVGLDPSGRV